MYTLDGNKLYFNNTLIDTFPDNNHCILCQDATAVVYSDPKDQDDDIYRYLDTVITDVEATCWLFHNGHLIHTLIRNTYSSPPIIKFYNNHLVVYEEAFTLKFYTLEGQLVHSIHDIWDIVYDFKPIDSTYFLLIRQCNGIFSLCLYNWNKMLQDKEYTGHEIKRNIESIENVTMSCEQAEQIEQQYLYREKDKREQITLLKDFYASTLIHSLLTKNIKNLQFVGDPSDHLKAFEDQKIIRLVCYGGDTGNRYNSYWPFLVKSISPIDFNKGLVKMIGIPIKDGIVNLKYPLNCHLIFVLSTPDKDYKIRFKNTFNPNDVLDTCSSWQISFE